MQLIKKLFSAAVLFVLPLWLSAQEDLPKDYLPKEFHASRREALRKIMPPNSVAVVFSFPERNYSNDVNYPFHQNPDLYYLSGYNEPNSVLVVYKENQKNAQGQSFNELFFVQKRNAAAEQWTGRRLGVEGVKEKLGFSQVFNGEDFSKYPFNFSGFDHILFSELPTDVRDSRDGADLFDLLANFKKAAGITDDYDPMLGRMTENVKNMVPANFERMKRAYAGMVNNNEKYKNSVLNDFIALKDSSELKAFQARIPMPKYQDASRLLAALREVKTPEEIAMVKKAVRISGAGQVEVMKAINPGMSETEIQGLHEYIHKKYGAEGVGYPSIVGAAGNGCILHYIENNRTKVGNNLVLMDVGAEYHGYTADITRTIPSNGKFTAEQKAIYDIVYDAQEAVFQLCKEGTPFQALNMKSREVLAAGLMKLGIIQKEEDVRLYYPHGVSHHLGLDVHDANTGGTLRQNMILTVEPGIYIPENSPCDKKWWGIAVRIEDDVVIGKEKGDVISAHIPRKAADVEQMVAKKSALDNLVLPALDK
ncbi:MAG TPA: aminopeptidase P family protein [Sphingobacteriaceae bacterium]